MNGSFYTAALGASGQQTKIDVLANNIANVKTIGYKPKTSAFSNLVYRNMDRGAGGTRLQAGVGVKINTVTTNFSGAAQIETGQEYDFAIADNHGFFMLQDPATGQISYTRNGHFSLSVVEGEEELYLVNDTGKRVLNWDQEPVTIAKRVPSVSDEEDEEDEEDYEDEEVDGDITRQTPFHIGVFDFQVKEGLESIGGTEFIPTAVNGDPVEVENARLAQGSLEESGVNFAKEMARLVETQRAYSYALKMLQTSDEVESMINSLR